jgi:diguanylate cyclase (GGDEF)-like protein/PAS domain S-box-containing protein
MPLVLLLYARLQHFIMLMHKRTSSISHYFHSKISGFSQKNTIEELKQQLDMLTSYSSDTIYRLRYDSMRYDYISPAVIKLLGFTPEELRHIPFRSLIIETRVIDQDIRDIHSFDSLEKAREKGEVGRWQADYLLSTKDGRKIWVTDISSPWYDDDGKIIGSIGCLRDITDRIEAEERTKAEIERLAHTDTLTNLHNRRAFFFHTENELRRVRHNGNDFAILLIDVDHFKKVNDSYGHHAGDQVLVEMGEVIHSCLRESDIAARVGGEEFGVFLPDTNESGAYWVADRICRAMRDHSFIVDTHPAPIKCTVSIGIATTENQHNIETSELYKQADTRLYIAKNTGRNQVSADEIMQLH